MDENKEVISTDPKREKVRVIPLSAIDDAPDHPFGVRDDEEMAELRGKHFNIRGYQSGYREKR